MENRKSSPKPLKLWPRWMAWLATSAVLPGVAVELTLWDTHFFYTLIAVAVALQGGSVVWLSRGLARRRGWGIFRMTVLVAAVMAVGVALGAVCFLVFLTCAGSLLH
jgi:hypothetical protein